MRWIGKFLGALIGYLIVKHPIGAVVGLILGHAIDERATGRAAGPRSGGAEMQAQWLDGAFAVMGHVAKSDGRVSEDEISAARGAMQMLRLDEAQRLAAMNAYTRGKAPDFDLASTLDGIAALCRGRPDLRSMFLQLQLLACLAGNDLQGAHRQVLQQVAGALGVGGLEFARFEAAARLFHDHARRGPDMGGGAGPGGGRAGGAGGPRGPGSGGLSPAERLAAAYATLGVEASATDADVTKAYRRQMSQNHPDKLAARGLPPAMMEVAKEKTQRIREAWEIIRDARGLR